MEGYEPQVFQTAAALLSSYAVPVLQLENLAQRLALSESRPCKPAYPVNCFASRADRSKDGRVPVGERAPVFCVVLLLPAPQGTACRCGCEWRGAFLEFSRRWPGAGCTSRLAVCGPKPRLPTAAIIDCSFDVHDAARSRPAPAL